MLQPRLLSFIAVEVPQNDICDQSVVLARAFRPVHIHCIFELELLDGYRLVCAIWSLCLRRGPSTND